MAQPAQHWRNNLSTFLLRRMDRRHQNDIVLNNRTEYHIGLDVSHFGTPLAVEEFLLGPPQPTGHANVGEAANEQFDIPAARIILLERIRIVLIPTPPPLPTPQMLIAATRALNPVQGILVAPEDVQLPDSPRFSISSTSSTASTVDETGSSERSSAPLTQCQVCMSNLRPSKFPAGKITENCYHPALTCLRCLEYSIASDHNTKMWDNITCPQCLERLSYDEIKRYADDATFAHYDHLMTRSALSQVPNFVWCTSCSSGQLHTPDSSSSNTFCPAVTCNSCNAVTCFNHRVPWHNGLRCSQYDRLLHPTALSSLKTLFIPSEKDMNGQPKFERVVPKKDALKAMKERSKEQKASVRDIQRVCKRCPGEGCGTMIFKIDGCKHMTCLACTHEFCWRCKRNWFYGHKCWKFWGVQDY